MDFDHQDEAGYKAGYFQHMVGSKFKHHKRGVWTVTGFVWLGEIDAWGIVHISPDHPVPVVRTFRNFYGRTPDGVARFVQEGRRTS